MARGISLHLGLNKVDPDHYDGWDGALNACEFDANDMKAIAESRGFDPTIMLTQEATSDAVVAAIENAAGQLGPGDIFFATYSGHGGQVPDGDAGEGDEVDRSDETWLLYDRQLVDDELFGLWAKFQPGVRIVVLSDSCHSGTVTRAITDGDAVPEAVKNRDAAAAESPRYRAMPQDVMIATYRNNRATYDGIQRSSPNADESGDEIGATVLLISGCQDDQLSLDGFSNGLFTENLLSVWKDGEWTGPYPDFREAIRSQMPEKQQPNYTRVGAENSDFEQQSPFTVG
jgi:metacaspase-1